jgi:prephenate dehydratase
MPLAASAASRSAPPRAGYLGPEGTFSEQALLDSVGDAPVKPLALETIRDAVMAVQEGAVEWSLVPIENSIEGSVTVTLDTLVGEAVDVVIVGEAVLAVRHCLIAGTSLELEEIEKIVSHPHVPGQCLRFLQEKLPHARIVAATSTAEAVRLVAERQRDGHARSERGARSESELGEPEETSQRWAAIGTQLAADLYGCTVIAEGIQDREDNETRFVWLARSDSSAGEPAPWAQRNPGHKSSLVFWGAGADHAGWLVRCLDEFGRRGINLTKIESRPMRERLGHYMFFLDLEGSVTDAAVSEAVSGLREMCERVRVLGSYPMAGATPRG